MSSILFCPLASVCSHHGALHVSVPHSLRSPPSALYGGGGQRRASCSCPVALIAQGYIVTLAPKPNVIQSFAADAKKAGIVYTKRFALFVRVSAGSLT